MFKSSNEEKLSQLGLINQFFKLFVTITMIVYLSETYFINNIFEDKLTNFEIWSLSIVMGILLGIYLTYLFKVETINFQIKNKELFLNDINIRLARMSHYPETHMDNFITYRYISYLELSILVTRISVQIDGNSVCIIGPKNYIKKFLHLYIMK